MGERRLKEITSAIVNAESITDAMEYISNLAQSEVYLLLRYVSSSRYAEMSFLSALMVFSKDYLKSKIVVSEEEQTKE